jgi:hypothetical protein
VAARRGDDADELGRLVAEEVVVERGRSVEAVEPGDERGHGVALGEGERAGVFRFEERREAALRVLARLGSLVADGGEGIAGRDAGEQVDDVGGGGHRVPS